MSPGAQLYVSSLAGHHCLFSFDLTLQKKNIKSISFPSKTPPPSLSFTQLRTHHTPPLIPSLAAREPSPPPADTTTGPTTAAVANSPQGNESAQGTTSGSQRAKSPASHVRVETVSHPSSFVYTCQKA